MIRIPLILILLAGAPALSWAAGAATAADPWYEIELIVFERSSAQNEERRQDGDHAAPALPRAVALTLPASTAAESEGESGAYRLLSDAEFKLSSLTNRLLTARAHAPLLHVAWRQPVTTNQAFTGVYVHSGVYGEEAVTESVQTAIAAPASADDGIGGDAPAGNGTAVPLEGVVKLSRGRFLHLNLDLRYRKAAPPGNGGLLGFFQRKSAADEQYRLQQTRRVRNAELQYFDHPRFGAIVMITPIDRAAAELGAN